MPLPVHLNHTFYIAMQCSEAATGLAFVRTDFGNGCYMKCSLLPTRDCRCEDEASERALPTHF